jgi:hypothetical protein
MKPVYRIYFVGGRDKDPFIQMLYRDSSNYLRFMPDDRDDPDGRGVWYFVVLVDIR